MASIKDSTLGYIFVPNFFNNEELKILNTYVNEKLEEKNLPSNCYDSQSPLAPSYYKDSLMQAFLKLKKDLVEEQTGLLLYPAYTYWRYYIYGSILKDHLDRPACEVSVTACINQSEKWPIHMNNTWIEMKPGDGVIYLGAKVKHGRKTFEGDHNAQVFFHYVDQHGPYSDHAFDQGIKN